MIQAANISRTGHARGGNVITHRATGKAMQPACKYRDFLKCERYIKKAMILLLGVIPCYFLWRADGMVECTSEEKSVAEKLKTKKHLLYFMQIK